MIALLCQLSEDAVDAIRDYTLLLSREIAGRGINVTVYLRAKAGNWIVRRDAESIQQIGRRDIYEELTAYDWTIVQYNPYYWGPWGVAPWLPAQLWRLSRGSARLKVAVMAHEMYTCMRGGPGSDPGKGLDRRFDWRREVQGLWQRAQLRAMRFPSRVFFASVESWADRVRDARPRVPTFHMPVASTLSDMRLMRQLERRRWGWDDDTVVLVSRGSHSHYRQDFITRAANAAAAAAKKVVLLVIGAGVDRPTGLSSGVRIEETGTVAPETLACSFAAGDIYLAPFFDGVSTRRTTLMAALQHGLAIVGTNGIWTDSILAQSRDALRLVALDQVDEFAREVVNLSTCFAARRELGLRARALYEIHFDWPVLATKMLAALGLAQSRPLHEGVAIPNGKRWSLL